MNKKLQKYQKILLKEDSKMSKINNDKKIKKNKNFKQNNILKILKKDHKCNRKEA